MENLHNKLNNAKSMVCVQCFTTFYDKISLTCQPYIGHFEWWWLKEFFEKKLEGEESQTLRIAFKLHF